MAIVLELHRIRVDNRYTWGKIFYNGKPVCETLELPWKGNERFVSCIPANRTGYKCKYSDIAQKGKGAFEVFNVIDRDSIQIHRANKLSELLGCIAVGTSFNSSDLFLFNSRRAFDLIYEIVGKETFIFKIFDHTAKTEYCKQLSVIDNKTNEWKDIARRNVPAIIDTFPEPKETKPKIEWYIRVWAFLDGKKTIIGSAGAIAGHLFKTFGQVEIGTTLELIFAPLAAGGIVHKGYKSKPSVGNQEGIFYKTIRKVIEFIQRLLTTIWVNNKSL